MAVFWLVAVVVFLLTEMVTLGLFAIWIALGCVAGAAFALLGMPLWMQIMAFLVITVVILLLLRPIAVKIFNKERRKQNDERYIGRTGIVVAEVDNRAGAGEITMDGRNFAVKALRDTDIIPVGRVVQVIQVAGRRFVVKER